MADITSPSSRPVLETVRFWLFGLCNGALLEAVLHQGYPYLWPFFLPLFGIVFLCLIRNARRSTRDTSGPEPPASQRPIAMSVRKMFVGMGAGSCGLWLALGADGRVPWFGLTLFVLGSLSLLVLHAVPFPERFDAATSLRYLLFAASVFGIAFFSGVAIEDRWPWLHDILFASGLFGLCGGGSVVTSCDPPWEKAVDTGYLLAFMFAGFGALPFVDLILKGRAVLWASLALPVVAGAVTAFVTYAVILSCPAGPNTIEGS